jgi:hypothetical protein
MGAPVFAVRTQINATGSSAAFIAEENHSVANVLRFFINGSGVEAIQEKDDDTVIYLLNQVKGQNAITVSAAGMQQEVVLAQKVLKVSIKGGALLVEEAAGFPVEDNVSLTEGYTDVTMQYLANASFEEDVTYGKADGDVTLGSITYNPCYVNTVSAVNSKWPNVLPVKGWTAANGLTGGSNFARMYSMPYSATQYCVSPSNVGNYAARCSRPVYDEDCGDRVLTVLNSWDSGSNAIVQSVTLPAGKYRVLMNARYECPNQQSGDGKSVTTSEGNVNTSLTGVIIGKGTTDYRYPTAPNTWEVLCYDFDLDNEATVQLSLGYRSSQSKGAANQTLLYIDNIQLLTADHVTAITSRPVQTTSQSVYDLQGRRITTPAHPGVYVKAGKKMVVVP